MEASASAAQGVGNMAPPEGSKHKKNRKRSKKRTPLVGACASSDSGGTLGEQSQEGQISVPSIAGTPKPVSPNSVDLTSSPKPKVRIPQATSPKKGPSQGLDSNVGSVKGEPSQLGKHIAGLQHTKAPKGGTSKKGSPKITVSNGPVSAIEPLTAGPTQPVAQNDKTSKSSNFETLHKVRVSGAEALAKVPSQEKTKLKSLEKQSPQKASASSQSSSVQESNLSSTCSSQLLALETQAITSAVTVENSHSQTNVKEQNISSDSVTERTNNSKFNPLNFELNSIIMTEATSKLDHLCNLLDRIVIQHSGNEACSNSTGKPISTGQDARETSPVKIISSELVSLPSTVLESTRVKSKEEIERERKARKDAKKMSKKKNEEKNQNENKSESDNHVKMESKTEILHKQKPTALATITLEKQHVDKQKPLQQIQKEKSSATSQGTSQEGASGKSKADLRRERREKQEAQRQAKITAIAKQEPEKQHKGQVQVHLGNDKVKLPQKKKKSGWEGGRRWRKSPVDNYQTGHRIPLLGHLTPHSSQPPIYPVNCDAIHPAIRTLGLKMKDRIVDGSTARVVSTLAALKRFISDYRTPESCDLSRDLAEKLLPNVAFLNACRPQAIAMDNAIRFLKHKVNSIEPNMPEAQAKDELRTSIDEYVRDNINLASSTIASHAASLIQDGDVILTFGYSALMYEVIEAVYNGGNIVSVVVVDSPYPSSGAAMVKRLSALGVTTYYRLITDVTHIMHKVTKVVVEAEAVMMNGAIQGTCGTAGLALAAANHDTPFIVLCHTYKFCNNDLTDSLVINELGDADTVVSCPSKEYRDLLANWRETQNLNVVNLVYDVTPACLVTALVTEQSVLPTSAVPVIIRRNYADILGQD
ncbi:translation initiation factor eIF2B subunit delta isoform X2 [Procambarus clarkii]|uniref:translation initiation factor eIF2B subunit delta isoform X2 n=1 Tax=Procambarus clarkii TaxID=6728 RepID=UPI001E670949|nr:translation initiation factor eIF-2B subunit delta-like isoform X1 [Procambarus clarkii]